MKEEFKLSSLENLLPNLKSLAAFVTDGMSGGWSERLITWAVLCAILIYALQTSLKTLADIVEYFRKLGTTIPLFRRKDLALIQRQQFCKVVQIDLENLALSENWMDQWFTDLETEVEVEGRAHPTAIHKLFRIQKKGNWREASLMSAIRRSKERRLLLVGEPGSGKSVALRHLGILMAKEGGKSTATNTKVPLYINLRGLRLEPSEKINAEAIARFVKDYFRSENSSTRRYVKENWDAFLTNGTWCFLFDSFDEIPAVMHAERGSATIQKYAQAIHDFITDMSECRGVLASREYKGPESIRWPKLRILPLDNSRQLKLIKNTSLTSQQTAVVVSQLAHAHGGMYKNPMLLSLLCNHVKDNATAPKHHYGLLIDHILNLSKRDEDDIREEYGLNSRDLMRGAEEIASIIAQNNELGLAPTFAELVAKMTAYNYRQEDAVNLLNALIYAKIGRNDVKEAKKLERRFAFSHRRYQETLFVRYIVNHPNTLSPRKLLTGAAWREYTVALLQSQDIAICRPLLVEASALLAQWSEYEGQSLDEHFSLDSRFFMWSESEEVHLLSLLQDGLERRLNEVPEYLASAIECFLNKRWSIGDFFDKIMCIRYGGLTTQESLLQRIHLAVGDRTHVMRRTSFEKISFLRHIPPSLATWVRSRIADETLIAADEIELCKFDLLASKLPVEIGALTVFNRSRQLRSYLYAPFKWVIDSAVPVLQALDLMVGNRRQTDSRTKLTILEMPLFMAVPGICVVSLIFVFLKVSLLSKLVSTSIFAFLLLTICRFAWRESEKTITPVMIITSVFSGTVKVLREMISSRKFLVVFASIISFVATATYFWQYTPLVGIVVMLLTGLVIVAQQMVRRKRYIRRIDALAIDQSKAPLVLYARTAFELTVWLEHAPKKILDTHDRARSLLALLEELRDNGKMKDSPFPLFSMKAGTDFARQKDLIVEFIARSKPDDEPESGLPIRELPETIVDDSMAVVTAA